MAAGPRKRESINRAVAADTRHAAEQRIARDLPGNRALVSLKDDFVLRHLRQIGAIRKTPREDAQSVDRSSES